MRTEQHPVIIPGMQIPYSRKPFLGKARGKLVTAVCNLLLRAKITSPDQSVTGRVVYGATGEMCFELKAVVEAVEESGSSSVVPYRVKSVPSGTDYFTAAPLNSAGTEGTTVNVALPWKLRESLTSAIIYGTTWNYTYATVGGVRVRTASDGTTALAEVITPPYFTAATQLNGTGARVGDIVFVASTVYSGVAVSGSQLTLIDLNADGKAWALQAQ